jgi:hypothetical protein
MKGLVWHRADQSQGWFAAAGRICGLPFLGGYDSLIPFKLQGRSDRMHDRMNPDMMWGMGAFGLLGVIVLVLVIAALIKYLFFR